MAIKIRLSNKLLLTNDKRQFILKEVKIAKETKRDDNDEIIYRKGDELYFPIAFYPNLHSALKQIPDRVIMQSSITKLDKTIKIYNDTLNKLLNGFTQKLLEEDENKTIKKKVIKQKPKTKDKNKIVIKRRKK